MVLLKGMQQILEAEERSAEALLRGPGQAEGFPSPPLPPAP